LAEVNLFTPYYNSRIFHNDFVDFFMCTYNEVSVVFIDAFLNRLRKQLFLCKRERDGERGRERERETETEIKREKGERRDEDTLEDIEVPVVPI
jgi:hypothetical protein